jgi:HlyD family secretion protein
MRAFLGVAWLTAVSCSSPQAKDEVAKPVVAVKIVRAERGDVDLKVTGSAAIFPREQSNVSARLTVPIRELRARKGDSVRQGQTLALLEDRDIRAQRDEAVAAAADTQASLEKLRSGTLPNDIERARGQVVTAEAAFQLAQRNYDRRKDLFAQGAIPQRDLNVSEAELAQSRANLDVARRALDLLQNQTGERDIRSAESRLQQAQARVASIDAQLAFTELKSPLSGTITEQMAYPGDMARPDAPIFTVVDLSVAVARAQVPESEAAAVRQGQTCGFSQPGLSGASGRVSIVNRAVDPARRTVEVWCEIASPPAALRSGTFGSVSIVTGQIKGAVLVPKEAVQFEEGSSRGTVVAVDGNKTAHIRQVEAGAAVDGRVQVVKGIEAGELVVIEGGFGLPDGTRVSFPEGSP